MFFVLIILFDPVVSIVGYFVSIILPMLVMLYMGNKFNNK